jgi:polar amino acid transport system substrate-binding protein
MNAKPLGHARHSSRPARRPASQALLGLALIALTATPAVTTADSDLAAIRARGKLVMLCFAKQDSTFVRANLEVLRERGLALAELREPEHFEGTDVDLMKAFAASLGLPLEVRSVTTSYADLFPALAAGEGDIVASSITITPERQKVADFSAPYLQGWAVVAVPLDSTVAKLSDLAGKRGVGMRGSSQLEFFKGVQPAGTDVHLVDFTAESFLAVTEGEADYMLMDSTAPIGQPASPAYPDVKVAIRLRPFDYGFAVRPGSDLKPELDRWIAAAKASGDIRRLAAKHGVFAAAEP